MSDLRPDPDALLAKVKAEEAKQARGKLKVFFGMAPGVGKTYAMLEAARKIGKEGADVVVGYIEPHARPETQALVLGLDVLPRREIPYRGTTLYEFDLAAALERNPQVILVDELAHTNAPGMMHAKRWQDVEDLLAAGIDVYTTLNVQHIESLNDVIAQITHIQVRETVPDDIFDRADEIELVDIAPNDLIDRLREGKVYVPEQARRAIENFFQKGHLIALREMALRRAAERVDAQMVDFRQEHSIDDTWPATERLLVCVGPSPMSARLVRTTKRMAAGLKAHWMALHVETPRDARMSTEDRARLAANLHLAEQLGAEIATVAGQSLSDEVVAFARSRNVTKIIVGKPQRARWQEWLRGSYVYELTCKCGDIDVYVISGEQSETHKTTSPGPMPPSPRLPYLMAAVAVAICTAIGFALVQLDFDLANIIMVYLLGIVIVSLKFGRGPSVLASILSVAAFDFFFIPPHLTFAVSDTQYIVTFFVMLATGLIISALTSRLAFQAAAARGRENRTAALFALSRELAGLEQRSAIAEAAAHHVASAGSTEAAVLLLDDTRHLQILGADPENFKLSDRDQGVAEWAFDHNERAGLGTSTLPGATALFLPLGGRQGNAGVLAVRPTKSGTTFAADQIQLLETLASLTTLALERSELAAVAEHNRVQIETERLRNSLLSAVSHDLRTPLAAIAGASSTLVESGMALDHAARHELAESIYDETERLNRLVANVLDMTRLEGEAMTIKKDWHSLEEIIGVVLNRLARQLAGHHVEAHLDPNLPLVPLDDLLIQQVFMNLLENAIRFGPSGTAIEISVRVNEREATVEVADCGPGLPVGDEAIVFDKFYRGHGAHARGGAGLGLAICRGVIELHGGKISAENRPSGGALFRFTLPIVGKPPEVVMEAPYAKTRSD